MTWEDIFKIDYPDKLKELDTDILMVTRIISGMKKQIEETLSKEDLSDLLETFARQIEHARRKVLE